MMPLPISPTPGRPTWLPLRNATGESGADSASETAADSSEASEDTEAAGADAESEPVADTTEAPRAWYQNLLNDPVRLGIVGAVAIGLLGLLALLMRRRRKTDVADKELVDEVQYVDDPATVAATAEHNDPAVAAPSDDDATVPVSETPVVAVTETDTAEAAEARADDAAEDETLSEADVYLAYGLHGQAEELLTAAVDSDPDNADYARKLLQTYHAQGKADAFASRAQGYQERFGGTDSPQWASIAAMGYELDPGNALYSGSGGEISSVGLGGMDGAKFDDSSFELPETGEIGSVNRQFDDHHTGDLVESELPGVDLDEVKQSEPEQAELDKSEPDRIGLDKAELDQAELDRVELDRVDANRADVGQADPRQIDAGLDEVDQTDVEQDVAALSGTGEQPATQPLDMDMTAGDDLREEAAVGDLDEDLLDQSLDPAMAFDESDLEATGDFSSLADELAAENEGAIDFTDFDSPAAPTDDSRIDTPVVAQTVGDEPLLDTSSQPAAAEPGSDAAAIENELTFEELSLADIDSAEAEADLDGLDLSSPITDELTLDLQSLSDEAGSQRNQPSADEFGDLENLDLPELNTDSESLLTNGAANDGDDMDTMMDLARAYIDMGDKDSASNTLDEIVKSGSPAQVTEAETLLRKIS